MKKGSSKPSTSKSKSKRTASTSAATAAWQISPAGNLSIHFQKLLEEPKEPPAIPESEDLCILSQDFFCTPDYITPEMPNVVEFNKEGSVCPKSPEKSVRTKRHRKGKLDFVFFLCFE